MRPFRMLKGCIRMNAHIDSVHDLGKKRNVLLKCMKLNTIHVKTVSEVPPKLGNDLIAIWHII